MSPKPTLQVVLTSPSLLTPGDHVKGKLIVDVVEKTFELTGIYVELLGKELSYVRVGSGKNEHTIYYRFTHVDLHRTVYGATKASGKRGGALLAPGHYEYPFDLQIPYGAPPSYRAEVFRGGSRLHYKLRGVVSVPLNRSIKEKLRLIVLPVVSFEQTQFARANTLTSPEVDVPVTHFLGLSTSKTQSVKLKLQLCPSVMVLGGAMSEAYYKQQRQASQGGGAVVMGKSLADHAGSDDDDDDSDKDDDLKKDLAAKHGKAETDESTVDSAHSGNDDENGTKLSKSDALPGKLLHLYSNGKEESCPFQPGKEKPGVVCARVIIENHTKDKIKSFQVALRQKRVVTINGFVRSDALSLSKVVVDLPKGKPCLPGDHVAVDVELPTRLDFVYREKCGLFSNTFSQLRRRPLPNVTTPSYSCENDIEVTFKKFSVKRDLHQFPRCVLLAEVVGAPGAPYVSLPVESKETLVLPQEALDAPVA